MLPLCRRVPLPIAAAALCRPCTCRRTAHPSDHRPPPAGYSTVQGPSTCMVRPHPAVWRFTHGIMVCYLLFLTYLLFQNVDDARQLMRVSSFLLCCGPRVGPLTSIVMLDRVAAHVPRAGGGAARAALWRGLPAVQCGAGRQLEGAPLQSAVAAAPAAAAPTLVAARSLPVPRRRFALPLPLLDPVVAVQVLQDTVWDEFVLAHILGWFGKALILRNYTML